MSSSPDFAVFDAAESGVAVAACSWMLVAVVLFAIVAPVVAPPASATSLADAVASETATADTMVTTADTTATTTNAMEAAANTTATTTNATEAAAGTTNATTVTHETTTANTTATTASTTDAAADPTDATTVTHETTTANAAATTRTTTIAATATTTTANATTPEIVAVYPNPVVDGDAGEFVIVRFPEGTRTANWSLADGESNISLPNETVSGRIAVSTDPAVARNLTETRVLALAGDLSLANGGETVRLVRTNRTASNTTDSNATALNATAPTATVSTVTYENAPEGERWHRTEGDDAESQIERADGRWRWTPLGATDFEVAHSGPTEAQAFVLPDSPAVPIETLREADRRILLAGYTFASPRVADALASATQRGVEVRVLVDSAPVGGLTRRSAKLLDSLVARGIEVRVLGGPRARYNFHHAKYAVADDRALVMTENWKPSGTGGHANRGWGAVLRNEETVNRLVTVFQADSGWRGATAWSEFRRGQSFTPAEDAPANGSYPSKAPKATIEIAKSSIIIAPDNAENALLKLLDSADESIRVQQVAIGGQQTGLLQATLRAARRGVEVEILLSSAWYVEEDNRKLVEWLNERAETEDLPVEARMAKPRGRYEKIHAKGVVVDGEAAVVGSLNWNNHSVRENREVAVILRGEEVGGFYAEVFDSDWKASAGGPGSGGASSVPVGLLGAVAVGALVAIAFAKRDVVFEDSR